VQVAAQNYFGHDVSEVDLAEAALLAGLPRAPSRYSPARKGNTDLARERQEYVLEQMQGERMISQEEVDRALARPILVVEKAEQVEDGAEDAGPISKEDSAASEDQHGDRPLLHRYHTGASSEELRQREDLLWRPARLHDAPGG